MEAEQKTPHNSPWPAYYGMSIVKIVEQWSVL